MPVPWVSAQVGLNGRFFIPRLLHRQGRLAAMVVPLWYQQGNLIYRLLGKFYWNAPSFYHPELSAAPVCTMLGGKLWFELRHARDRKTAELWDFIDLSNRSFARNLDRLLKSGEFQSLRKGPPGIFISWSDISLEAIRFFHSIGWKTVTLQLNCGPLEEALIATECARYPLMTEKSYRAPPGFHERTLQEYRETDHIVSNSAWGRNFLLSQGIAAAKISMVPFAYEGGAKGDFTRSYPAAFDQTRPLRVLHIGQMSLRKGMGRFFEAIQAMSDWPVEFTFAGAVGVPIPAEVAANPKVRILGVVPRQRIEDLYREADVFLFPTLSDAFGLTQLECMGWKLPLIASRYCGDVVNPGVNGLRLEQVTSAAITEALRFCLEHPGELARWSVGCSIPSECSMDYFGAALLGIEKQLFPERSVSD